MAEESQINQFTSVPRCAVIVNYFGKPPEYFQLWLDSCAWNDKVTWLFYTDIDHKDYIFPTNVVVKNTSLETLRGRIQSNLEYTIKYESPWQFCALRPGLGFFLQDDLTQFDYWGWGDCDVIYGDLTSCLKACAQGYDKILPKGHLSFVKNDEKLNHLMVKHPLSRVAWEKGANGLPCYDEEAIRTIVLPQLNALQNNSIPFVNTKCRSGNYVLSKTTAIFDALGLVEDVRLPFVMSWCNGELTGHFALPDGTVRKLDLAYVHFFRRNLRDCARRLLPKVHYLIVPNIIKEYDGHELSYKEICKLDRWRIHWSYFMKRLNWRTIKRKLHISRN